MPRHGGEVEGKNMYTMYILKNSLIGRHYIGSTNDLVRRVIEHNRGQTRSTKQKGVWELVYSEEFETAIEAKKRELQVKSYKGGNGFKNLLARD